MAGSDLRRVTGYQDFVDDAALDLVYVADHGRMKLVPAANRESYASVAAGAITQNVYLFAAGNGLSTVIRAWIDRDAIADALGSATTIRCCCRRRSAFRRSSYDDDAASPSKRYFTTAAVCPNNSLRSSSVRIAGCPKFGLTSLALA